MPKMREINILVNKPIVGIIANLYYKIGATKEFPEETERVRAYCNDFYKIMFLENGYIPNDIPFDVLMECFSRALIYGKTERKGNNISAMVQALNDWLVTGNARNELYTLRDRLYPEKKALQLTERKSTPVSEIPTEELKERIKNTEAVAGFMNTGMVTEMLQNYKTELERRNELH